MDLIADSFESNEHTLIDMALMMERIAVQRPYFAFERLYQMPSDDWDIWGDFMPEQPLGHEVGPLAIAEAGRHLAIWAHALQRSRSRPRSVLITLRSTPYCHRQPVQ